MLTVGFLILNTIIIIIFETVVTDNKSNQTNVNVTGLSKKVDA